MIIMPLLSDHQSLTDLHAVFPQFTIIWEKKLAEIISNSGAFNHADFMFLPMTSEVKSAVFSSEVLLK